MPKIQIQASSALSLKLPSCVSNSLQHLYLDVKCVSQMQHVTKRIPGSQILLFPPQSSPSMKSDAILPVAQIETMRVNLGFSFPLKLQIQTFSKSCRVQFQNMFRTDYFSLYPGTWFITMQFQTVVIPHLGYFRTLLTGLPALNFDHNPSHPLSIRPQPF